MLIFLSEWSIYWWELDIKVTHYYCIGAHFSYVCFIKSIGLTSSVYTLKQLLCLLDELLILSIHSDLPCLFRPILVWSLFCWMGISIVTPAFFRIPFAWNIIVCLFTSTLCIPLAVRWVSCIQKIAVSHFVVVSLGQGLTILSSLALNWLCSQGWLQTASPPASASWLLGLQRYSTVYISWVCYSNGFVLINDSTLLSCSFKYSYFIM